MIPDDEWSATISAMTTTTKNITQRRRPKWASTLDRRPDNADEHYHSRTITRALDVLEAFSEQHPALNLKQLSRSVHLPESSLFRILLTLQSRGYLQQNIDGTYQLSGKVLFGRSFERAESLRELARPVLQALVSEFNESASLAYLFDDRIQVLEACETFHEVRVTNRPGRVLPPHCSALGKVIAAFQPLNLADRILEVYGLIPRTPKTIVDRSVLLRQFEKARRDGYAYDREESTLGGICVAAAIRPASGVVVAAISVSTPVVRMNAKREKEIVQAVLSAARQIGARIDAAAN